MLDAILNLIDILDKITIVFSTVTMFVVLYGLAQNKKQNKQIQIYFKTQTKEICLKNISIIRKHITRSEILGILGIFQKNSKDRYNIDYLSTQKFFDDLYELQRGKTDRLVILLTDKELEQFIDFND